MPIAVNAPDQHPWNFYPSAIGLVALAGSAGSLQAFQAVLKKLPCDFPVPVLICQHRANRDSEQDTLVEILQRSCAFPLIQGYAQSPLHGGMAYVAPPGRHLRVLGGRIVISDSPAVDYYRPSVNGLFESLATEYGERSIVVVLSGCRDDGAAGVIKVKAAGGRVIVQDPLTAVHPSMPNAAISSGCADYVLPLEAIANALTTMAMVPGSTHLFTATTPACATPISRERTARQPFISA